MAKIPRICKQCGAEFFTYKSEIAKGGGKFCGRSCATTFRNIHYNPTLSSEVRKKISKHHADISGKNNPMYGRRGELAPSYIDGRNKYKGDRYRRIMLANTYPVCELCGEENINNLHVHHKDKNRKNNTLDNLMWVCSSCHNNIIHKRERDTKGRFVPELMEVV